MAADVFYASAHEIATLNNTWLVAGVATDPDTVTLTVTAPDGTATTYTYAASQITRTGTGAYSRDVTCSAPGTWQYEWIGTGAAEDTTVGSWEVQDPAERVYVPLEVLRDQLGIAATDTTRDALLLRALRAASRAVDSATGRRFWLDAAASARTYHPSGRVARRDDGELLLVDDIGAAAGLVVETGYGSTWSAVPADDYETLPDNATVLGVAITGLLRPLGCWCSDVRTRVRVTARWGWPAVPDVVEQATLLQATRLYRRKDSPEGVTGSADWGITRVSRVDPDVQALIADLTLPGFG